MENHLNYFVFFRLIGCFYTLKSTLFLNLPFIYSLISMYSFFKSHITIHFPYVMSD